MLNFAYTLCSSAMFVSDVLGVGYGQVFCVQCLFVLRVARKHGLVSARGPRVTVVFLTLAVLAQGGGGVMQRFAFWALVVPPSEIHSLGCEASPAPA